MSLPTIDAVAAFLGGLGDTEDDVAAAIRARGIRETLRYDQLDASNLVTRNCVIALLLRGEFEELNDTEYWEVSFSVLLGSTMNYAPIPGPVLDLMERVDEDRYNQAMHPDKPIKIKYPDLIAPPAEPTTNQ
jgi:hypothetical protein